MKTLLILLQALLGIGAIYGGGLLIIAPSGALLGVPSSLLETAPFQDFFIPGLILFLVLGIAPCLIVYGLVSKKDHKLAARFNLFSDMHWAWSYSIYSSIALIIWIQLQMVFINDVFWAHTLYVFWGIIMIVVALHPTVRKQFEL